MSYEAILIFARWPEGGGQWLRKTGQGRDARAGQGADPDTRVTVHFRLRPKKER
jgi:hypothetical protein